MAAWVDWDFERIIRNAELRYGALGVTRALAGFNALAMDVVDPFLLHGARLATRFAADNDPVDISEIQLARC
ncbi:hypothetical protein PsSCT_29500 [Pseudomonas sp. SCT]|jgi:hypothetical protein